MSTTTLGLGNTGVGAAVDDGGLKFLVVFVVLQIWGWGFLLGLRGGGAISLLVSWEAPSFCTVGSSCPAGVWWPAIYFGGKLLMETP